MCTAQTVEAYSAGASLTFEAGSHTRVRNTLRETGEPVLVEKSRSSPRLPVTLTYSRTSWQSWSPILIVRYSCPWGGRECSIPCRLR